MADNTETENDVVVETKATEVVNESEKDSANDGTQATTDESKAQVSDDTQAQLKDQKPVLQSKSTAPPAHYVSFFEQYVSLVKEGKADQAIKAINNCVKAMLKANTVEAFNIVSKMFKANKEVLKIETRLQSIAILPAADRATLEIVSTIFHVITTNPKAPVNLEVARGIIKSDQFINWCAKKIG